LPEFLEIPLAGFADAAGIGASIFIHD